MSVEKKSGFDWPKPGISVFGAFSGTILSEKDIERLQKENLNNQAANDVHPDILPETEQSATVWEAKRAVALRSAGSHLKGVKKILKQIFIPDEYSVFIRKK